MTKLVEVNMGPKKATAPRRAPVAAFDFSPRQAPVPETPWKAYMGDTPCEELTTEEHAARLIEEFNIYGRDVRERLIAHLTAAEQRGNASAREWLRER